MANNIPEAILARYRPRVAGNTVYGYSIDTLSEDELRCMLVMAVERIRDMQKERNSLVPAMCRLRRG